MRSSATTREACEIETPFEIRMSLVETGFPARAMYSSIPSRRLPRFSHAYVPQSNSSERAFKLIAQKRGKSFAIRDIVEQVLGTQRVVISSQVSTVRNRGLLPLVVTVALIEDRKAGLNRFIEQVWLSEPKRNATEQGSDLAV